MNNDTRKNLSASWIFIAFLIVAILAGCALHRKADRNEAGHVLPEIPEFTDFTCFFDGAWRHASADQLKNMGLSAVLDRVRNLMRNCPALDDNKVYPDQPRHPVSMAVNPSDVDDVNLSTSINGEFYFAAFWNSDDGTYSYNNRYYTVAGGKLGNARDDIEAIRMAIISMHNGD